MIQPSPYVSASAIIQSTQEPDIDTSNIVYPTTKVADSSEVIYTTATKASEEIPSIIESIPAESITAIDAPGPAATDYTIATEGLKGTSTSESGLPVPTFVPASLASKNLASYTLFLGVAVLYIL